MTDVIFAKSRHVYDSYSDFWRLVELSGFPIVYVDEMDLQNGRNLYITAPNNGDLTNHMANHVTRNAKVFLWNLERPGDDTVEHYRRDNQAWIDAGCVDEVIVSDKKLASVTNFHYIPVGSHIGFGFVSDVKIFDVVHLMCYSLRRAFLFDYLTPLAHYNGISIAPNGWGDVKCKSLSMSKFMLSIHQDDHMYIEPLRFALAAAYGLPIISEFAEDVFPYVAGAEIILLDDVIKLDSTVRGARRNYRRHASAGLMMRNRMCGEFSFRRCIERYM